MRAGESRFDYVPMPAGRDELRRIIGADMKEDDLDRTLSYLENVRVGGFPCVAGFSSETTRRDGGGRPFKSRVVHVGAPLAPMALERVFLQAGTKLPAAIRWYGPVLPPNHAPLVGDHRTRDRQRAAFVLGLGALLVERREEYAERGIRLADLRRPLEALGIYHRSHASLVEDMLGAWVAEPAPMLPLPGSPGERTGPVLVEVEPGSGLYRLGPDYATADQLLILAAEKSSDGRERLGRSRKRRGRAGR